MTSYWRCTMIPIEAKIRRALYRTYIEYRLSIIYIYWPQSEYIYLIVLFKNVNKRPRPLSVVYDRENAVASICDDVLSTFLLSIS